jgi:Peptidase family M23
MAPRKSRAAPARLASSGRAIAVLVTVAAWAAGVRPAAAAGPYAWPVRGPVIHPFEQPSGPFGPGHRGIDIAVPFGTELHAAQDGVVAFAGWVAGSLFVSVDHDDGVRTTYSWLSAVSVRKGDSVSRGQDIGATGHGHPEVATPHLHFGARIGSTYIDPMTLLGGVDLVHQIHLAPLGRASPASMGVTRRSPVPSSAAALALQGSAPLARSYPGALAVRQRARDPPRSTTFEHGPAPTIAAA